MTYYVAGLPYSANDIYHHGIKGQRWGVRRFQNADGTRTAAGKARYSGNTEGNSESSSGKSKLKTALKVGAVVAGTALVAYGGYKLSKVVGKTDFSNTVDHGQSTIHNMLNNNLSDLSSGITDSSSRAKGAASELSRMSEQLKTGNVPKPPTPSQVESLARSSQSTYNNFVSKHAPNLDLDANVALRAKSDMLKARAEAMKRSASSSASKPNTDVDSYTRDLLNRVSNTEHVSPRRKLNLTPEVKEQSRRMAEKERRATESRELDRFMRTMNIRDSEEAKRYMEFMRSGRYT